MKKIGIITFHKACNYGAVLQAYALQNVLQKNCNEYDVEIIDYYCPAIEDRTKMFYFIKDGSVVKNILRFLYQFVPKMKKIMRFKEFRKKFFKLTKQKYNKYNINDISDEYEIIFTGSDQVWNYKSTGEDKNYFLQFANKSTIKCSYAASFGFENIISEYKNEILRMIDDFEFVSLRENIGLDLLREKLCISPNVNVDPTLLLTKEEWEDVEEEVRVSGEYILLYCILKTNNLIEYTRNLSRNTGLKVYSIGNHRDYKEFIQLKSVSVGEFLKLIKNAKYVVTTSFHGTVFSILYHKQFVTELNTKGAYNSRVEYLLNLVNLNERDILKLSDNIDDRVNWDNVEENLNKCRSDAKKYFDMIKGRNQERVE